MTTEEEFPDRTGRGTPPDWRRQAGFLGAVFAVAAAVIAAGLRFAPQVSAYSGLSPWALTGLLGLILVLAGACVLFAVTLASAPAPSRTGTAGAHGPANGRDPRLSSSPPPPPPPPWSPDGPVSDLAGAPTSPAATSPASTSPSSTTPGDTSPGEPPRQRAAAAPDARGLTILGTLLGVVGLALSALTVVLSVVVPTPTESIMVQFTDLYGRVQLEYCPALPGSFAATASHADLVGEATILPVKVTADVCGNPDYTEGVWIYLNRESITVSDRP